MKRSRQPNGFTLTEVLVATTLLAIIMSAVYGLLVSIIGLGQTQDRDDHRQREAHALLELLQRDYANLHAGGSSFFHGDNEFITLYTVGRPLDPEDGEAPRLLEVVYRFDRAEGVVTREEALVEGGLPNLGDSARPERGDGIERTSASTLKIAGQVSEFDLRYLWMPRPESAYWQDRPMPREPREVRRHAPGWGYPQAISVRLRLAAPEGNPAEDLVRTLRLPTRTLNRQRDPWELDRMLGGDQ